MKTNKKMKKLLLSVALFSAFGLAAQTTSNQTLLNNKANWKNYTADNYSIQYPNTWDLAEMPNPMLKFTITSRPTSADDIFRENINLVSEEVPENDYTLNQYVNLSIDQIKMAFNDFELISKSKHVSSTGIEYEQIIYTASTSGFNLIFQQNFMLMNGKSYILTFTAEKNKYADYDALTKEMIDSFSFLD